MGYIQIFNTSLAQRCIATYFKLQERSTKEGLIAWPWCSIWPPNSRIAACNRCSQYMQTSLATPILNVVISVVTLCLSFIRLGAEVQNT